MRCNAPHFTGSNHYFSARRVRRTVEQGERRSEQVGYQTDSACAANARAWIWQRWGVDVEREGRDAASAALRAALDALVHDAADHLAAQVNNEGLSAQLTDLIAAGYLGDTAQLERDLAPPMG
jgi:hypothetical protein